MPDNIIPNQRRAQGLNHPQILKPLQSGFYFNQQIEWISPIVGFVTSFIYLVSHCICALSVDSSIFVITGGERGGVTFHFKELWHHNVCHPFLFFPFLPGRMCSTVPVVALMSLWDVTWTAGPSIAEYGSRVRRCVWIWATVSGARITQSCIASL